MGNMEINDILLEEKVRLLSGTPDDFVSVAGIPEKGITADTINGIRPASSTQHVQLILGPTINTQRDPRAGRNFKCFSEDPLLSRYIATTIVNGIQSQGYEACVKHFAFIGEYARHAVFTGGGSASCNSQYRQVPVALLRESLPQGTDVSYSTGVRTRRIIPMPSPEVITTSQGEKGVEVSYFNAGNDQPLRTDTLKEPTFSLMTQRKPGLQPLGSPVEMSTILVPRSIGTHTLALRHSGAFTLRIDSIEVLKGGALDVTTEQFMFNL
ncbi:uncharacterized protein FTOL_13299 [Fusarium torulosum]|uniref:beta-glucosidase n=1 Tax=Fusarium torulosum TaxID=33205 RepID=A0AAE8MP32_9HYPO|nr:uncharacterized protein FTOL_13299 [Fusarium torulosum]